MCRTAHALLQTVICGIQMLVRVFMTIILMFENLVRMILQTLYNFISFLLQMISLIPICVVFLLTARLKCFMCGGGGPCPANRGGACDCLMSAMAIIILFVIFRATGVLDKIFYKLGYSKTRINATKFLPTPGDVTECSRETESTTEIVTSNGSMLFTHELDDLIEYEPVDTKDDEKHLRGDEGNDKEKDKENDPDVLRRFNLPTGTADIPEPTRTETQTLPGDLTTILYYLV